ncbi:MAG: hypothetical protein OXC80_10855 [Gammaproteobacteria bacterium]|nr:hypothetical protein [Gammaproteobacteria bacterium]
MYNKSYSFAILFRTLTELEVDVLVQNWEPLRRIRAYLAGSVILILLSTTCVTQAETGVVRNATIEWLNASDSSQHTCVVQLDVDISTEASTNVNCDGSAVAMKCGGTTDGVPSRTFDLAMFAFENRREISVRVDDSKKLGEICYATRIWVTRKLAECTEDDDRNDDDCDAYHESDDDYRDDDD